MAKSQSDKPADGEVVTLDVPAVAAKKFVVAITQFGPHLSGETVSSDALPADTDFDRLVSLGVLVPATVTVPA